MNIFLQLFFITFGMDCQDEDFNEFNSLYSNGAPSYSTAKSWYNKFNLCWCLIQDQFCTGHQKSVIVPKNINAV